MNKFQQLSKALMMKSWKESNLKIPEKRLTVVSRFEIFRNKRSQEILEFTSGNFIVHIFAESGEVHFYEIKRLALYVSWYEDFSILDFRQFGEFEIEETKKNVSHIFNTFKFKKCTFRKDHAFNFSYFEKLAN